MQIEIDWKYGKITLTKEAGDPRCSGVKNGAGESRLLYHLKNKLNSEGWDLIKKRMGKDGHLVDDMQQYLRTRNKRSKGPHVYIYSPFWAIEGADARFNRNGKVTLLLINDVFEDAKSINK